jgi:diacylglycerol kinase (ATP)
VRACVIFNPAAKGNKARRFRRHLDEVGAQCELKQTAAVEDARRLAAEAVREGFELVVAAGGDGTVNETLNGIAEVQDGLQRTRLGVLPLGTVNVFARELGIPLRFEPAWQTLLQGRETLVDLPVVEYRQNGEARRRHFAQLAGAGLDARAIELVDWSTKKKVGPLAYVVAGFKALFRPASNITITDGERTAAGQLVLIGNGRLYGGEFRIFPRADLRDGLLEVCVFPRANWLTLLRCAAPLLLRGRLPPAVAARFQSGSFTLAGTPPAPLEVDGELIGHLPASFSVQRSRLRVIVPQICRVHDRGRA